MTTAIDRFIELLRIPTVSSVDEENVDWGVFATFRSALVKLYPLVHERLEVELVAGHALLIRWPGLSSGAPLVLMAHQDVVPADPAEWTTPPFSPTVFGEGEDETIRARGAIDDKGALVAILEAVEALLADGFSPARDVYLAFGHNEETAGDGAGAIVSVLDERGVRPGLVLDEGGAVVEGVLPGVTRPTAMIGVAERGVMTLTLTVAEAGGHASTPPRMPATARLARAIDRLRRTPFRTRITPPVRAMFATAAQAAPPALAAVFRSLGWTGPVLSRALALLGPETNALVRTTAVVTELSGATGENVLATRARAVVNIRLLPGDTVEGVTRHVRRAVRDDRVEVEVFRASNPSPVSPWRGEPWQRLSAAVRSALGDDVLATPYVQLGASDSRFFTAISEHVYRFTPFHLTRAERDCLHAPDERIRVQVWLRGIEFYRDLLRAS